ncbi:SGNH/GDSL hydrolase family protein [Arthrobacter gandavensis]|uniref:SGNH/GDSL hydrolase family protein n=1 Tax=Arthrobacter gandavensis TaxID=169960 RepID=UPI0018905C8E|nr:SGNH/GDSL hydrolase family protein [Arthrobacter gandavensis]MBF4994043.1 SGNH/GDSL hydrolase family protein [Arthrobacter gandavensis]
MPTFRPRAPSDTAMVPPPRQGRYRVPLRGTELRTTTAEGKYMFTLRKWGRAAALLSAGCLLTAGSAALPAAGAAADAPQGRSTAGADRDRGHHGPSKGWDRGPQRTVDYVALGDSYAAGYGGGAVLDSCGRTAEGYPALLDALRKVELDADVTCAGATASSTPPPAPSGPVDLPEQIASLQAAGSIDRNTDLVTLTIGGNDVRFTEVVASCAGPEIPATCAPALAAAQAYAETTLAPQVRQSLEQLRALAPRAELVLAGYPHLFDGAGVPGLLSPEAAAAFNAGTDALNAVLAAQLPDRRSTYVDVVDEFAGHGIGSADPWIIFEQGPFDLHPDATGYREGYLAAITADVDLHPGGGQPCRGRR